MHEESELIDLSELTEVFGFESFLLKSVGITIGSSTSHLMFSELMARRRDSRVSRFEVVERKVTYRSPIVFTPYVEGVRVDTEKLKAFIQRVYRESGMTPDSVDTGAVIITGYAARKENAEAIVNLFSHWAGKFVCATAGPKLEGMMAAHGSGATLLSKETGKTVMNVDIGGGTSKVVIAQGGRVVDTSSLFVGSRVIAMNPSEEVVRIEESADFAARELGIDLKLGAPLSVAERKAIVGVLTNSLFELLERKGLSAFTQRLMESPPLQYQGPIDMILFSGGVAEYIYGHEKTDFGDLGAYLGEGIKERIFDSPFRPMLEEPAERIRATVMGAAQYSLQVSGNTIFLSSPAVLPKRNLQVVKVLMEKEKATAEGVRDSVRQALGRYDIDTVQSDHPIALTINFPVETIPDPSLLRSLSQGILSVLDGELSRVHSIVLIFDIDIANLMGSILAEKLGSSKEIICLDGIEVGDLDYVDIGTEIESSRTVPVVVKNLVFLKGAAQREA
ncbi:MAG: ethanolamine ammonia-lyase reactivating factor EutA [Thermodesulfobacteriota bacterium]